jgi:hypothetical protein
LVVMGGVPGVAVGGVGEIGVAVGGTAVGGTAVGAGGAPVAVVAVGGDTGDPLAPYDAYCAFTCWPQLVSAGPL